MVRVSWVKMRLACESFFFRSEGTLSIAAFEAAAYSTGGRARAWGARFFGETIVKVPEA